MKVKRTRLRLLLSAPLMLLLLLAWPAYAVDGPADPFELDGNALQDGVKDDWQNIADSTDSASTTTARPIIDGLNLSIFTQGGSKDIRDVSQWRYTDGSVPDKDEILNAAAAAYEGPDGPDPGSDPDLLIYFAADRYSNDGDAQIGFWFFQNEVTLDPGSNKFIGTHKANDVLVLTTFEGGGKNPFVQVLKWDPSCSKADGPEASLGVGNCAAPNLRILLKDEALCMGSNADSACAINNTGGEASVWSYEAKPNISLGMNVYPEVTLFEGGANISQLFEGEALCFASFLAETRSSASPSAQLKDFALGSFPLCKVELSKDCSDSDNVYDPAKGGIPVPYQVKVENTGFATVDEIDITDDQCSANTGDDVMVTLGPIAPGDTATYDGECLITEADLLSGNMSNPPINGVSAVDPTGKVPVVLANSCLTIGGFDDVCFDPCAINSDPMIAVTKKCVTRLAAEGGVVKVRVNFGGTVTNTSDQTTTPTPLTNVTVAEIDPAGGSLMLLDAPMGNPLDTPVRLEPGETAYYMGSYDPDTVNSECPSDALFMDTVQASGEDPFSGADVEENAMADCKLCPPEGCEDLTD